MSSCFAYGKLKSSVKAIDVSHVKIFLNGEFMSEAENETPGIFSIEETSKEVTINHTVPPDMPLLFSDQMIVRSQGGLFQLYFFQTRPPIALTPDDIRSIDQIEAVCIGQFVITPEQMARNIEALSTNYKRHLEKIEVAKAGKR